MQDITAAKLEKIDRSGQMNAVNLTQAVIEFTLDGTILTANQNFLQTVGYQLDEIQGRHHSMFVDEQYKQSQEYQHFWQRLRSGEFFVDEYKRFGKGGKEIWIQASYNPIMDSEGKPYKVVKYATNVTQRKMVVNEVKRVMTALSSGDLSAQLTHPFEGEFAELGEVISQFIVTLRQIITDINSVAATIKLAATEISNGNTDLSSRTEQQASNLEQTAASGGELIEQVVVTMASINESAQKIADIIGVIDGIAFQTNILALNAAVEAARTGEQGRGFSVVASEVRSLAQRSANAAKDIKALISDSVSKISNGNELVDRSGSTMKDIVVSIKRVHDLMADIASASAEQATGINEVNQAVNQMDEMTQQNAALVEEAAAASESLLAQAEQLYDHVAMFRLPDQDTSVPSPLKAVNKRAQSAPVTRHPASHIAKTPAKITAKASSRAQPAMQVAHDEEWESF
ncbi:methyl-accepting chemotaxis protein [Vibrio cholerae]|nr:methyl-accepting chemotaxis protein [Vibrio cholerae]